MDIPHITPHPDGWTRSARLKITTYGTDTGAAVVHLAGEIDQDEAPALHSTLARTVETRPVRLVVDLEGVTFSDSAGLNVLLKTRIAAAEFEVDLFLAGLREQMTRLLSTTGTTALFTITDTVDDALTRNPSR